MSAVRAAEKNLRAVAARIGVVSAPELLNDTRPPIVKHDEIVTIEFLDVKTNRSAGLIVQWNCHPETLDSQNTKLSSDYVGPAVDALQKSRQCPVVYLTGSVGGMMTTIRLDVRDAQRQLLPHGSVEKTNRYGELLAAKAISSLAKNERLAMTPFEIRPRLARLAGRQQAISARQTARRARSGDGALDRRSKSAADASHRPR